MDSDAAQRQRAEREQLRPAGRGQLPRGAVVDMADTIYLGFGLEGVTGTQHPQHQPPGDELIYCGKPPGGSADSGRAPDRKPSLIALSVGGRAT